MQLDRQTVINISEFVINNFSLQKLDISWSEIRSSDMLFFMSQISSIKHLKYLNISSIPLEGKIRIDITNTIKEHISSNTSLIHLDMSWCNIDADELEILVEGIRRSKSLLAVHFSGNSMSEETKLMILNALGHSSYKKIDTIVSW
jgi:hypothetical protein